MYKEVGALEKNKTTVAATEKPLTPCSEGEPKAATFLEAKTHGNEVLLVAKERISVWTLLPKENSKPLEAMFYRLEQEGKNLYYFSNWGSRF